MTTSWFLQMCFFISIGATVSRSTCIRHNRIEKESIWADEYRITLDLNIGAEFHSQIDKGKSSKMHEGLK